MAPSRSVSLLTGCDCTTIIERTSPPKAVSLQKWRYFPAFFRQARRARHARCGWLAFPRHGCLGLRPSFALTIACLKNAKNNGCSACQKALIRCDFASYADYNFDLNFLSIFPSGGTQRLPRLIGVSKAKEMIFTGKMISGVEAEEIGLADYAVKQNENGDAAYQRALVLAEEILPGGPVAVRMAKLSINRGMQVGTL